MFVEIEADAVATESILRDSAQGSAVRPFRGEGGDLKDRTLSIR
jgi:hypothetical protein